MSRECAICGCDLSEDLVKRRVEMFQTIDGVFCEDNVYELCANHYAAIARVFESEES